eukprot:1734419-Amphidinium_carterae.1
MVRVSMPSRQPPLLLLLRPSSSQNQCLGRTSSPSGSSLSPAYSGAKLLRSGTLRTCHVGGEEGPPAQLQTTERRSSRCTYAETHGGEEVATCG